MKQSHRPLVVANWKMNPDTVAEAKRVFIGIRAAAKKYPSAEVVVAPPHIFITELQKLSPSESVTIGAQNVHHELKGAYTGETSINMLSSSNVRYVIVGHSERRAVGETDEMVAKKVQLVLKAKQTPIVCVGERERDVQGNFYSYIESQVNHALAGVPPSRSKDIVIAYEPIWAIGTGKNATNDDVVEMQLFILKILTKLWGRKTAEKVRVLYGGSVNADNAQGLFSTGSVNGFLVGGASLKIEDFTRIIKATV